MHQVQREGKSKIASSSLTRKMIKKENLCGTCKGQGTHDKLSNELITVEAGSPDNHVLKFLGKGHESLGLDSGELHVKIRVQKHSIFTRKGADLEMTKELSLKESLCGKC